MPDAHTHYSPILEPLCLATFNVENLFSRARLLSPQQTPEVNIRAQFAEFLTALDAPVYDADKLRRLLNVLGRYIDIRTTRGVFMDAHGNVVATSPEDWAGHIDLKLAPARSRATENTAKVINAIRPDVLCVMEVESRATLQNFSRELLDKDLKLNHAVVFDGNDQRKIDVGVLTRFGVGPLRTHVFDWDPEGNRPVFDRDCLEIIINLPNGQPLHLLINHFKSKHGDGTSDTKKQENDRRRTAQAARVAEIAQQYDLRTELVAVCGDLNDTPDSPCLQPLLGVPGLHDVLDAKPHRDRWTHHYHSTTSQIDFILVSEPLRRALGRSGVERRGIHAVAELTGGQQQPFPSVNRRIYNASDHGAVWAHFDWRKLPGGNPH